MLVIPGSGYLLFTKSQFAGRVNRAVNYLSRVRSEATTNSQVRLDQSV